MTGSRSCLLLLALALPLLGAAEEDDPAVPRHRRVQVGRGRVVGEVRSGRCVEQAGQQRRRRDRPRRPADRALGSFEPDLYVIAGDGSNVRRLTNSAVDGSGVAGGEDLAFSQASWSPGGDQITFDGKYNSVGPPCEQHCAGWDVLVIGADGSGLEQIALNARAPAWSPDGRRVAYESDVDAYYEAGGVTVARLDVSVSCRVKAINFYSDIGPVWSPTGNELAFQARATEDDPSSIYTVRANCSRMRRLALGHDPAWSPDGRRLAFVDDYQLITIDSDGKRRRRLSRKGEFVVRAAWSPKGGRLAYVAGTQASYGRLARSLRVEIVSADGKRVRVLAREPASSLIWGGPVWTPDGKRILVAVEPH
jgi:Tol biopolymer transport system component